MSFLAGEICGSSRGQEKPKGRMKGVLSRSRAKKDQKVQQTKPLSRAQQLAQLGKKIGVAMKQAAATVKSPVDLEQISPQASENEEREEFKAMRTKLKEKLTTQPNIASKVGKTI